MSQYPKPNLKKFFITQLIFLVSLAVLLFALNYSLAVFLSALLGGLSIFIPNIYFAEKFFSFQNSASGKGLNRLLAFQAGKILFAIICLAISLILLLYLDLLMPKYFLGAYIFMLFLNMILATRLKNLN